jgi:CheY-like chemotaxis protein
MERSNAVLREAMAASRPLFESSGHRLHLSLATQPVLVQGDRARLIQVFTNLLNNSAQFTPRGGQIWLMVETDGSEVYVVLKDNGIGIEPERLPRIFDLFSLMHSSREAAPSGLGIGLSLVRALVELHGGRVEARSAGRGQGAEFIVHLPLAAKGNTTLGTEEEMAEPASYRILVVDDNVDSATSLTMMLRMMGHEIKTAHDGKAALAAAHSFRPDIILLDIGLPELSGYEVCQRIRQEPWGQNMVIIAQTGWGQEEDRRKSKEMGFNYHLVKPVDPALLTALIGGILHASEA